MSEPPALVLHPLRRNAAKVLTVPLGLLAVGLTTGAPVLSLVATMWTVLTAMAVLTARIVLDDDGIEVRSGLRGRRVRWPEVRGVSVEQGPLRRQGVSVATAGEQLRLPAPPGFFRTDEAQLAEQLQLVQGWWRSHGGSRRGGQRRS